LRARRAAVCDAVGGGAYRCREHSWCDPGTARWQQFWSRCLRFL